MRQLSVKIRKARKTFFLSEGTFLKVYVFAKNNCGAVHYILQG